MFTLSILGVQEIQRQECLSLEVHQCNDSTTFGSHSHQFLIHRFSPLDHTAVNNTIFDDNILKRECYKN